MKKFIVEESEVKRILSMHKVIKEQESPAAPKVDPLLQKLRDAVNAGCLSNGKIYLNKTKNMYYYRGVKQSTKQEIDFYPDMTYKFVDGSKNGNWKCDNIEANAESTKKSNDLKTAFIDKATKAGYLETLTPEQEASGLYKKYKVPGSEEFFPPNGLEMFYNPASVSDTTTTTKIQSDTESNIPKDIKDCKTNIEMYYTNFTRKRPMSQVNFDALKNKVQACKNEFYGNWGILRGGRKMDNILDIMSGKEVGGPSRRGEDAKWRLN